MTEPTVLEKDYQDTVVKTLRLLGWHTNHTRRAIGKGRRWTTPTSAVGFPDLLSVKGSWLLAVELKSDVGKLTDAQQEWLGYFAGLPCARVWVLRPRDPWDQITGWLRDPAAAPAVFGWTPTAVSSST